MKETDVPKLLRPFYKDYRNQLKYFNKISRESDEVIFSHLNDILKVCGEIVFDNPENNSPVVYEHEEGVVYIGYAKRMYLSEESVMVELTDRKLIDLFDIYTRDLFYIIGLFFDKFESNNTED